jgi:preprotein translocase subunit SecA
MDLYKKKEQEADPGSFLFLHQISMLKAIDDLWMDHLLSMDQLKEGVGLRGYGQMDPLKEYQKEGYGMFVSMIEGIKENTLKMFFRIRIEPQRESSVIPKKEIVLSRGENGGMSPVKRKTPKVGRNQPCPCGSGKKYKHCCGR